MPAKAKSGDKFPNDIKGEMIVLGSIVCIALVEMEGVLGTPVPELSLGFVSKMTQKNGIDVTIILASEGILDPKQKAVTKTIRVHKPHKSLNVIDRDTLKTQDKYHEALRMAAARAS